MASIAAAMPKWMNMSKRRASFADRYLLTSKPFTSPAICEAKGRGIEAGDAGDARFAGEDICPGFAHADAYRADDAQPGNDDSAFGQLGSGARNWSATASGAR